jgi:FAD dependent oxidoreductase
MFPQLDKELRFGYQLNGSLVLAYSEKDKEHLQDLKKRGEINGVKNLRIIDQKELREREPYVNPDAIAALYSPDAGNVIPYEYTIALAENAVDNGVQLRIRREVTNIETIQETGRLQLTLRHWEPKAYVDAQSRPDNGNGKKALILVSYPRQMSFDWIVLVSDPTQSFFQKSKNRFSSALQSKCCPPIPMSRVDSLTTTKFWNGRVESISKYSFLESSCR